MQRPRGGAACGALAALLWMTGSMALAQSSTNQITAITPSSAAQGTSGLTVTFTLDSDVPPPPPGGVMPTSVTIGTIAGTSVAHSSQHTVTAVFAVPQAETVGAKDASISFPTTDGTLTFAKAGGFTVTAGVPTAPTITQHPQSVTVRPGTAVSFTVAASGSTPLSYRWQKDGVDIDGATSAAYSIGSAQAGDAGAYRCVVSNSVGATTSDAAALTVDPNAPVEPDTYVVVDTGQAQCYNDTTAIAAPAPGQAFYGQDAQAAGIQPSYTLGSDGLTVYDRNTGLTWQRSPDTSGDGSITAADKLNWTSAQARPAVLNAARYGGYSDWRLPTIKELYSLIDFRGTDPSGLSGSDTSGLTPYIDTDYFDFAYGDTGAGERIIDSQYASSTLYVGNTGMLFGVNFADGRIKGYGITLNGADKTFLVICCRGNTHYGINDLVANGDGTVTDRAAGLMWTQADSGVGMDWESALAWAQTRNAANYLGYSDWRLPNAKELQSIVDYTRSPATTGSAAIDPVFSCTQITGENGQADYPWYWSGTTHAAYTGSGEAGAYVCFGKGWGYMNSTWVDVHGAGCQRSDPKSGSLTSYTYAAYGYYNPIAPQGDAVRLNNYVRLVRTMSGSVAVVRDLPDAILTTSTVIPVTLAVTVPEGAPNGMIISEQLPAGWRITGATWNGEPFAPVLVGGVSEWLFEAATGSGMPVESGTLMYTAETGGAGAGSYTFSGSVKWITGDTEALAETTGDTGTSIYAPTTVNSVMVKTGLTVEVTFSAAMGTGVETATNYALSGTGRGCLPINPDSVVPRGDNTYTLTWNSGEMLNGGDITIAVSGALDAHGLPLGSPNSGTDPGHAIGVVPTATFTYLPSAATNQNVVATLVSSETVTVTNNGGALARTFTENGTFEFQFADAAGNAGTASAEVTWIDRNAPEMTGATPAPDSTITTSSVTLDVTFGEAVQDVDVTDMVLAGTSTDSATAVASATLLGGTTWRFAVTGLRLGAGTLTISLAPDAGDLRDLAGNDLAPVAWSYTVLIPVHHPYDADQDWTLSAAELQAMKDAWAAGSLAGGYDQDYYILWAVDLWKAGAYAYDPAQTGYRLWQPVSR